MSGERRLQELEKRLQAMDAERVSLLQEIDASAEDNDHDYSIDNS